MVTPGSARKSLPSLLEDLDDWMVVRKGLPYDSARKVDELVNQRPHTIAPQEVMGRSLKANCGILGRCKQVAKQLAEFDLHDEPIGQIIVYIVDELLEDEKDREELALKGSEEMALVIRASIT